jgi:hypothetical protein
VSGLSGTTPADDYPILDLVETPARDFHDVDHFGALEFA